MNCVNIRMHGATIKKKCRVIFNKLEKVVYLVGFTIERKKSTCPTAYRCSNLKTTH